MTVFKYKHNPCKLLPLFNSLWTCKDIVLLCSFRYLLAGCLLRSTAYIRNSLDRSASSWQIMAGAILERPATLVVPFSPLQKAYLDMLTELEAEHSLLSDHELKALEEKYIYCMFRQSNK